MIVTCIQKDLYTKQTMGIRDFLSFSGTAYMVDSSFTIAGAIATRSNLSPCRRVEIQENTVI